MEGKPLGNECGAACKGHLAKLGHAAYPFGNGWPDTAPVGSFPANASPFGVLDMVGSVEEWTASDPCRSPRPLRSDPCAPIQAVVRGGGGLPAVARFARDGRSQRPALGFRCVHPGKAPSSPRGSGRGSHSSVAWKISLSGGRRHPIGLRRRPAAVRWWGRGADFRRNPIAWGVMDRSSPPGAPARCPRI